jgi:hypothetical protein
LIWVDDPTIKPIDFLVVDGETGWVAYDQRGTAVGPGSSVKGTAFFALGPPPSLKTAIEQSLPFQQNTFSFTRKLAEADYLLVRRPSVDNSPEYASSIRSC